MEIFLHFDGMAWPNPCQCPSLDHKLRYGSPDKEDLLLAASIVSAYEVLVMVGSKTRSSHAGKIKKMAKGR